MKVRKFVSIPVLLVLIFYVVSHIPGLLELPVFADEAIYIRWAQLIIDDPIRYMFFPMNDGKTPLFFWLLVPFQFLFKNQLFAARFVSVVIGLLQVVVVMRIMKLFTKSEKVAALSGLFVSLLPFWFFHHRMALTDGLLTLFISLTFFELSRLFIQKKPLDQRKKLDFVTIKDAVLERKSLQGVVLSGIWFAFALYSKIPAILFLPGIFLTVFFTKKINYKNIVINVTQVGVACAVALVLFGFLKLSPSFPQLFGRGSDFLFPISEVLAGRWKETIPSITVYIGYFLNYMTPTFLFFSLFGLFAKKYQKIIHIYFWTGVLFLLPIALMGKVVYPRYLFPAVFAFTISSMLGVASWFDYFSNLKKRFWVQAVGTSFLVVLIANSVATASIFVLHSVNNHTAVPFVSSDVAQYLTKWSSGHGIEEVANLVEFEAKEHSIAVGTEGSFGTLPDGLILYFHRENVDNIYIEGIGVPVDDVPQEFANRAKDFDRKWIVVNEDRMSLKLPEELLLQEFCRPYSAPCLQVWDITDKFKELSGVEE